MKTKFAIILTALISSFTLINLFTNDVSTTQISIEEVEEFKKWSALHKKIFKTPEEKNYRMSIFVKNIRKIIEFNSKGHSYWLKTNQFSDLTDEEKEIKLSSPTSIASILPEATPTLLSELRQDPPESINWSEYFREIDNEHYCLIDHGLVTTAMIEADYRIKYGKKYPAENEKDIQLSTQQILDCSYIYGNRGCSGGNIPSTVNYIQDKPLTTNENYSMKFTELRCKDKEFKPVDYFTIDKLVSLPKMNAPELLKVVGQRPVLVSLYYNEQVASYGGGYMNGNCPLKNFIAMMIVGYNVDKNYGPYWLIRNQSWGTGWGEFGYMRLARDTVEGTDGICGVNNGGFVINYSKLG